MLGSLVLDLSVGDVKCKAILYVSFNITYKHSTYNVSSCIKDNIVINVQKCVICCYTGGV